MEIKSIEDIYQTPIDVCHLMVKMIPKGCKKILEPTPGLGNMVRSLVKNGYDPTVCEDFFTADKTIRYDAIVMNPPFSHKSAYLENAPKELIGSGMKVGYHILFECMKSTYTLDIFRAMLVKDLGVVFQHHQKVNHS